MSIEVTNTRYAKPTTYIKIILGVLAAPLIAALVLISFIGLSIWAFLFFIFVLILEIVFLEIKIDLKPKDKGDQNV
nr:MAG TPA: hypothetical protein [Caudoviricetes sp.]